MARIDQAAYDASTIDWKKLHAWARRVAQSTPVPPTPKLTLQVTETIRADHTVREGGFLGIGGRERTIQKVEQRSLSKDVVGPHWVLDTRVSEEDKFFSDVGFQSNHQTYYMLLERDGSLTTVLHVMRYRDILHGTSPRAGSHREIDANYASVTKFTDSDVTYFDYEKVRTHWAPRGVGRFPGEAMNDSTGTRLQRHAKGVGLSIRLKQLSSGPLQPRPLYQRERR